MPGQAMRSVSESRSRVFQRLLVWTCGVAVTDADISPRSPSWESSELEHTSPRSPWVDRFRLV